MAQCSVQLEPAGVKASHLQQPAPLPHTSDRPVLGWKSQNRPIALLARNAAIPKQIQILSRSLGSISIVGLTKTIWTLC